MNATTSRGFSRTTHHRASEMLTLKPSRNKPFVIQLTCNRYPSSASTWPTAYIASNNSLPLHHSFTGALIELTSPWWYQDVYDVGKHHTKPQSKPFHGLEPRTRNARINQIPTRGRPAKENDTFTWHEAPTICHTAISTAGWRRLSLTDYVRVKMRFAPLETPCSR